MDYRPDENRYAGMQYRRCGRSGLKLPAVSLGLWHNFGEADIFSESRKMILKAFDLGITHFDIANCYGPPCGAAESTFGRILASDLRGSRREMVVSTKAGYYMWPGPYGEWGSRKYLVSSIDQSLERTGLDYFDIFYHHRPDPETPLEETMGALDFIVRSGRALYVGISNYSPEQAGQALEILRALGTKCLIHQPVYNMFNRHAEDGLFQLLDGEGVGCIVFSPLAQGVLTDKYFNGIPSGSRASKPHGFLRPGNITVENIGKAGKLNELAGKRGQTLAQLAVAWVLRHRAVTSALIGASRPSQIEDSVRALDNLDITREELDLIDGILA